MTSQTTFQMIHVVAGCLIKKDGRFLLVQEARPELYGLWTVPAGRVDVGETIEAAAVREAKEESGYDVKLIEEIALIHETATNDVKHIFSAEVIGGEPTPQEGEILDVKWFTREEVRQLHEDGKLRKSWVWDLVERDKAAAS